MRGTAEAAARPDRGLTEPSFLGIFRAGLPRFVREGFLPLGAFYAGLLIHGLVLGIAASVVASLVVYLLERRAGRDALLVRLSLAFVVLQAAVGLAANSATVYLAQPVLAAAAWGLAFLVSIALRKPLAGVLAGAWYPFPRWLRESEAYRRVFGIESLVWGVYFLARSGLRLAMLLEGGLESFLLVTLVTGTPTMIVLLAWSIRYSLRHLADVEPPAPLPAP